jgi:hypothetical protein
MHIKQTLGIHLHMWAALRRSALLRGRKPEEVALEILHSELYKADPEFRKWANSQDWVSEESKDYNGSHRV